MTIQTSSPSDPALILVVDDTPDSRVLLRTILQRAGYRVAEADSGPKALVQFAQETPQLVLLDLMMPDMDGFATCKRLRQMPGGENIPIVIATAMDDFASIDQAYEVGATDFVTKPVNASLLTHRLRYVLRSAANVLQLARTEAKHRVLLEALPDTLVRLDSEGRALDVRGRARLASASYADEAYVGQALTDIWPAEAAEEIQRYIDHAYASQRPQSFPLQMQLDGIVRDCDVRLVIGEEREVTLILRDVTEFRMAESQIKFLVAHDNLTQLPSRRLFQDRVEQALMRAQREENRVAVLFLDIDTFKSVNDHYGHDAGDTVLQTITKRLQRFVRRTDSIAKPTREAVSSVARFAGDEFTLMISGEWTITDVAKVARRVLQVVRDPISVENSDVLLTGSLGIAVFPTDGDSSDVLCTRAETAMRIAKENGGDSYQFHDPALNASAFERLTLENNLRRAMEFHEMILYYQPQIELGTGKVVGMEALMRWNHPELGVVLPGEFLPLARETGLVIGLDQWALREACQQQQTWVNAGLPSVPVAVNISANWLREGSACEYIKRVIQELDYSPENLMLEFAETAVLDISDAVIVALTELKELGVRITLDNFGTGYTSLGFLTRFPVSALKIDQTFVAGLPNRTQAVDTVEAVAAMAKRLQLELRAECIENAPQLAYLRESGCRSAQGHLLSPPMPASKARYVLQAGEISVI